jgi:hypothetical protein
MPDNQEPFFRIKLECPVCKQINKFEVIRQGEYTESGRDTDFASIGVIWKNPAYQEYDPLLFFTAACKKCYYTRELNSSYKEWQSDSNFKSYRLPSQKKKHLAEFTGDNSIIRLLGEQINIDRYPFESAIIKLLLAIYDENLHDRCSLLDIARFYIRIGWVYRNQEQIDVSRTPGQLMLNRIQMEIDRLKDNLGEFGGNILPLHRLISQDVDLVIGSKSDDSIFSGLKSAMGNVQRVCDSLVEDVELLQTEFDKVKREIHPLHMDSARSAGFGEYPGFCDFLYRVKERWDEIPVNETEALTLALKYYMKAYQDSREIKAGLQQLQAAYLIAELSRRVGDLSQAAEYFKISSKSAQELMMKNKNDKSIFSNARKILEMALEQGRTVKEAATVSL